MTFFLNIFVTCGVKRSVEIISTKSSKLFEFFYVFMTFIGEIVNGITIVLKYLFCDLFTYRFECTQPCYVCDNW